MDLINRIALVTGAAGPMGHGIALALAAAGCHLALSDKGEAEEARTRLNGIRLEIEALGREAVTFSTDVTDALDVRSLVAEAERVFGQVDVLINNAGAVSRAPVTELTVEEFRRVLDVNVLGTFLCCKTVAPGMIARRKGSIVNVASVAGKRGAANLAHFAASEFALIGFTQSLALELAPAGVRVNAVCPALVEAEVDDRDVMQSGGRSTRERRKTSAPQRTPLARPQLPGDIGHAVVFLCEAENVTGESLVVSGGLVMD